MRSRRQSRDPRRPCGRLALAAGPARGALAAVAALLLGWGRTAAQSALPASPAAVVRASAAAGDDQTAAAVPAGEARSLEERLADARARLAAVSEAGGGDVPPGVPQQDVWTQRAMLHRLVLLYEQQSSNAAQMEAARARRAAAAREAQTWTRFAEPRPYSVLLVDRLREEIQALRQRIGNGDGTGAALARLIDEHHADSMQAEGRIRQLNEQLESATDPAVRARLAWQRQMDRLRSQVGAASAALLDSERLIGQESLAEDRVRLDLLQRQLVLAEAGSTFSQADLEHVTGQIEQQRQQLERELRDAESRRLLAVGSLDSARKELEALRDRDGSVAALPRTAELVGVREAQVAAADTTIYVLRLMLEGANVERLVWELRFAAYENRSVDSLRESRRRLDAFAARLGVWREYTRQQLEASAGQLQLQETHVNSLAVDSELLPMARERLEALRARQNVLLRFSQAVARLERLVQRWAEGLGDAVKRLPLTGRVLDLFSDARSFGHRLWRFEVFTAQDTITVEGQRITGRRGVTVGKLATALLVLVVGYWTTGVITSFSEPIIAKRLKIEPNLAGLIRRWLRALMVVFLILLSMAWAKIPLTVFAFAGGALAIGLGFGMQTVLKNTVSGLILLFERPFRVGDVLDVAGQQGTVANIGLRASVLHLWDGTEMLIPNSSLLETNVTNWTYSDHTVRFSVTVGVEYGSDVRQVVRLLNAVVARHALVVKTPEPQVLLAEFGDSSQTFELRFWVDVVRHSPAEVASDLRLMIAAAFAEHGVAIAFPQRDLHLHAARPIPVHWVPAADAPAGGAVPPGDAPRPSGDSPSVDAAAAPSAPLPPPRDTPTAAAPGAAPRAR